MRSLSKIIIKDNNNVITRIIIPILMTILWIIAFCIDLIFDDLNATRIMISFQLMIIAWKFVIDTNTSRKDG